MGDERDGESELEARLRQQLPDAREREALDRVWRAFGCASNPNDFKAAVRDQMWNQVISWIEDREGQMKAAYDAGVYDGFQRRRASSSEDDA